MNVLSAIAVFATFHPRLSQRVLLCDTVLYWCKLMAVYNVVEESVALLCKDEWKMSTSSFYMTQHNSFIFNGQTNDPPDDSFA